MLDAGVRIKASERKGEALVGETVVFTGGLDTMTRDDAKSLAVSHGAKVAGSITKNVTLVVAGPGAGSKLDKAKQLGVKVVD